MSLNFNALEWRVTQGIPNTYPLITLWRKVPNTFPIGRFPLRVHVIWQMPSEGARTRSTASEYSKKVRLFEDKVVTVIEEAQVTLLLMIQIGEQKREFIFQVSDISAFKQYIEHLSNEESSYTFDTHVHDDPSWQFFFSEQKKSEG